VASLQDLEAAEDATRVAVFDALGEYLGLIRSTVFRDPARPDWVMWPSQAWPELFTSRVLPVLAREFADQLRAEGVSDESFIGSATASFVTQVSVLVNDPHIPTRVLEETTRSVASEEFQVAGDKAALIGALLVAGAVVWTGMVGVAASNAAAWAVNAATNTAAQGQANRGRQVLKTWRAVDDARTRMSHAAVDNTSVPFAGSFMVGGFPLRFPHDPFGPAQEIMNCRCVLSFEVVS